MGKTTFNYVNYGDEGQKRLDELSALLDASHRRFRRLAGQQEGRLLRDGPLSPSRQQAAEREVHRGRQSRALCRARDARPR